MEETNHLAQNIAKNIRTLRISKQLSQKEVAKAMEIHLSKYARLEKGTAEASIITIVKVARFFNVSIDKVVNGEDTLSKTSVLAIKKRSLLEKVKELEELNDTGKKIACNLLNLTLSKHKLGELTQIIEASKNQ